MSDDVDPHALFDACLDALRLLDRANRERMTGNTLTAGRLRREAVRGLRAALDEGKPEGTEDAT